jgi:hypothetical protein
MKIGKGGGKFTLIFIAVLIASISVMCTEQGTEKGIGQGTDRVSQDVEKSPEPGGEGGRGNGNLETGMNESKAGEKMQVSQMQFSIFYYYHPLCPNCQKIEPYMNLMKNVTEIDACNVGNISACSPESIAVLKFLKNQGKFLGVPTIAVLEGSNITLLIGWKQALKLGEIVESHGITPPPVTYNNTTYTVQECVDCHSSRGLKPPSTFNCTYCCHTGEAEPEKTSTG